MSPDRKLNFLFTQGSAVVGTDKKNIFQGILRLKFQFSTLLAVVKTKQDEKERNLSCSREEKLREIS
jgi:hypothetical protein